MGKSPGRWIKNLLLGKKSSKSNLSKGGEVERRRVGFFSGNSIRLLSSSSVNFSTYSSKLGTESTLRRTYVLTCEMMGLMLHL
ncbi:hypothetical protein SLEP1_g57455 [Rubroshorea leprosula]|uniref:Uncharacterized protein n=1 Tax=Rubroshorea leprosula TaxID=152421 RepID=A0AAV5MNR1_9ROSI|nr:hypothetical protein SLEP1_g57455 [Rubroshorea leprosula]